MQQITPPSIRVPRSRVYQTHQALRAEILQALEPVLFDSMDAAYACRQELEANFAAVVEQSFACAVHSGTVGLFLALRACGVSAGDEVITVGNSDISTTSAIVHCGATPVLCDIRPQDYTIDVANVTPLITSRTRAILPVDLYGHPADVRALREIAQRHNLYIVEDAALATGATDYERAVGAFAHATVFSFAPFKPLGSAGNGAMITTDDEAIARRLRALAGYGHATDDEGVLPGHQSYVAEGYNVPMDPLQAALVGVKLPYLQRWTERRREIARAYRDGLQNTAAQLPSFRAESQPTFRCYTIRVPQREKAFAMLTEAGVEIALHYTPPAYRHPGYSGPVPSGKRLPVTEKIAGDLLCLPVAPELDADDVNYVIEQVRACLRQLRA